MRLRPELIVAILTKAIPIEAREENLENPLQWLFQFMNPAMVQKLKKISEPEELCQLAKKRTTQVYYPKFINQRYKAKQFENLAKSWIVIFAAPSGFNLKDNNHYYCGLYSYIKEVQHNGYDRENEKVLARQDLFMHFIDEYFK